MAGEHDPDRVGADNAPTAGPNSTGVQGAPPADANLNAGEKAHADWESRHEQDGSTVMVGSRAIDHPIETVSEAEGDAAGNGNLYDRLAKKDQTPVEDGGSSSLS